MQPPLFCYVRVALDCPYSAPYDYRWALPLQPLPGMLVQVQFGHRKTVGLIVEVVDTTNVPQNRLRNIQNTCIDCPPLNKDWLKLITFAANYYHRSLGEVALPALPRALRDAARWPRLFTQEILYQLTEAGRNTLLGALPSRAIGARRLAQAFLQTNTLSAFDARTLYAKAAVTLDQWRERGWVQVKWRSDVEALRTGGTTNLVGGCQRAYIASQLNQYKGINKGGANLNDEQRAAIRSINSARGFTTFVLYGVTGSGKTEVYLQGLVDLFIRRPDAQALVMVPEISLTLQFEAVFREHFSSWPSTAFVTLHSALADGKRARNWLAAHTGRARIILGTRMAVLASLPRLALIIVDEEHEPAYKQQEGLCYSARDLAVWRAKQLNIPVVLGSATPSLETWWHACQRCYITLVLSRRAVGNAMLPKVRLIDMEIEKQVGRYRSDGLSMSLVKALKDCLARGEQSLVFLNRRGYAPILTCDTCSWVMGCSRCSTYLVLHKSEQRMRCHHCGGGGYIPQACPMCSSVNLTIFGPGTQRVEEVLSAVMPNARVLRIDADNTRRKGSVHTLLSEVHAGDIDILVGTQMIAKGHNFQRITLVSVLNADSALFSHDFRAGERLFSQLIQVSGRAGRAGDHGEVLIQTKHTQHPLYAALVRHDYIGFAKATLAERRDAYLPPFVFQALLRADSYSLDDALRFLKEASTMLDAVPGAECVTRYDPVPLHVVKVMHVHRAQLLLESISRVALQSALRAWVPRLRTLKSVNYWNIEVDPLNI
ncbi:primosomal protein N' [Candidatus Vallotia tarda]|uniref:Replication restart protein PriA n=1 Tax=Candidatus Vallotiella hemipterorum TaxID=1177213 RepID=A0A916JXG9_9BURK|nr:primosomal protein N' [Candidatus Vallotia tarda]CAG7603987.1 Primosomal protein N' [Candidatus Vallotia tarda]